jgi:hypothetical protein
VGHHVLEKCVPVPVKIIGKQRFRVVEVGIIYIRCVAVYVDDPVVTSARDLVGETVPMVLM